MSCPHSVFFSPVFRIQIGLSADPDPAIYVNAGSVIRTGVITLEVKF